ncbi:TPA: HepT-like ribonuclease domain-containing protein [Aeromonas hydrophila]
MNENRLPDYLNHIQQAAINARHFVEGLDKADFLADKRTQQAVIMSLIIIGEAATKIMDGYSTQRGTVAQHAEYAQPNGAWLF